MRKRLSPILLICIVALLFQVSTPIVHATPPITVEAVWEYTPKIVGAKYVSNIFFLKTTEIGSWKGDIHGVSNEICTVVIHDCDEANPLVNTGFWYVKGLVYFTGDVKDDGSWKTGTFVLQFVGKRADETSYWKGQWVILSGTGELATLHGQGSWKGPPNPGAFPNTVYVSGKIHFES